MEKGKCPEKTRLHILELSQDLRSSSSWDTHTTADLPCASRLPKHQQIAGNGMTLEYVEVTHHEVGY
jgi:hypothetical protein